VPSVTRTAETTGSSVFPGPYHAMNTPYYSSSLPVSVAARSEAWVCGSSLAGIVGLIPTGALMSVCCECCVL